MHSALCNELSGLLHNVDVIIYTFISRVSAAVRRRATVGKRLAVFR